MATTAGGLPYVESSDLISGYPTVSQALAEELDDQLAAKMDASAAVGKVLQVVSVNRTDTYSGSVTGNGGESGNLIEATITPSSASSKVLVMTTANVAGSEAGLFLRLYRASTQVFQGDAASTRQRVTSSTRNTEPATPEQFGAVFVDSPATTSATTYGIRLSHQSTSTQTVYLNRGVGDGDTAATPRTASNLTLLEIGA